MKQIATEAIVLSRIDFGEAGRILTLLTAEQGKISVLAKGVRKPKSKLAGGVELFSVSNIVYIDGKSDIKTLVSAQLKTHYSQIVEDIARSMTAYDILKYTNIYTETVCEDTYFTLVSDVLGALNDTSQDPALVWVWFGIRLLEISGHAINTSSDAHDNPLDASDTFHFEYQAMAFQPAAGAPYGSNHIKLLRLCQSVSLDRLKQIAGTGQAAEDVKKLILDCIKYNN